MRYLIGFVLVLGLVGLPLGVGAQAAEEGVGSEPNAPVDITRVEAPPTSQPQRTPDGYTLEEMELRVKRAKLGLIAPAAALVPGGVLLALGLSGECKLTVFGQQPESCDRRLVAGATLTAAGVVGIVVAGGMVGARKRALRRSQEGNRSALRRAQWDVARLQLRF